MAAPVAPDQVSGRSFTLRSDARCVGSRHIQIGGIGLTPPALPQKIGYTIFAIGDGAFNVHRRAIVEGI